MKNIIVIIYSGIKNWLKNTFSTPNKKALFIFGFQKSGTSAIAGLLSEKTGKSVTIDTPYFWNPFSKKIILGDLKVKDHVNKYSYPFSKEIIKEPNTTFFITELRECFNLDTYIFIVRNPFDNIRSILNRLGLPGNMENIEMNQVDRNWRGLFEDSNGKNYISVLAKKWVEANDQENIISSKSCILVRYEDFKIDKESYIENLAYRVGFKPINSIGQLVDKQYQPKGNSYVDIKEFFGEINYKIIERICSETMGRYHYD